MRWSFDSTAVTFDSSFVTFDSDVNQHYLHARYLANGYLNPGYLPAGGAVQVTGQIVATLGGLTPSLGSGGSYFHARYFAPKYFASGYIGGGAPAFMFGTFVNAHTFTGQVVTTLGGVSALFSAVTAQTESFELSISIAPTWQSTEYPGFLGSITATADGITASLTGTFRATGAIDGLLSGALDGVTGLVQGTSTAPANRLGSLSSTLDALVPAALGSVTPPGTFFGSVNVTLAGLTAAFTGQLIIPNRTGTIATGLDDVAASIVGIAALSSIRLGTIALTLGDVTCQMIGTGPAFKKATHGRIISPRGSGRRIIVPRKLH